MCVLSSCAAVPFKVCPFPFMCVTFVFLSFPILPILSVSTVVPVLNPATSDAVWYYSAANPLDDVLQVQSSSQYFDVLTAPQFSHGTVHKGGNPSLGQGRLSPKPGRLATI